MADHSNCGECGVPDDLCNSHYECVSDVWESATKAAVENLQQATNSDYAAALRVLSEYRDSQDVSGVSTHFDAWINQRLNTSEAKQGA